MNRDTKTDDLLARAVAILATLVVLLFAASLRDVLLHAPTLRGVDEPSLPKNAGERDAAIDIQVVDDDGGALGGTLVRVFSLVDRGTHLAAIAATDPSGKLAFDKLPRGETWVIARSDGHARSSTRLVLDAERRSLQLRMTEAQLLEVVVVDPRDHPIRGVEVKAYTSDPLPHRSESDSRGLVRFDSLPPGPYAVEVQAAGFDHKLIRRVGPEDSPLFVKLEQLGGLEVSVRTPDGRPAAGATVLVAGSSLWPARRATTDPIGNVTIGGLSHGFYDLRAERGDLISATEQGVLLERGARVPVILVLTGGHYVTVRVTDGAGDEAALIAQADVALVESGISSFPRYGRTDSTGRVTLGPIAGRDATVSARAKGFVARGAVTLAEDNEEVHVPLVRGGVLVGEVRDERDFAVDGAQLEVIGVDLDGMPIVESSTLSDFRTDHFAFALPGATPLIPSGELGVMPVIPDAPSGHGPLLVTRSQGTRAPWITRSDGGFELSPVTPGRIRLVARHPSFVEALSEPVSLTPGERASIDLVMRRGGTLEGRVLEADRRAVAGARVKVTANIGSLQRITYTADDGSFAFAALPKEVIVSVSRRNSPDHTVEQQLVSVPPDERTDLEIVLAERRDAVAMRIVDERGYPIDNVQILAQSLEPGEPLRRTLFTGDNGEAVLDDARGLPLRMILHRSGKAPTVAQLELAPERVELTMAEPLQASGWVESRNGAVADAAIALRTATDVLRTRSNAQGLFSFKSLARGTAHLLIVAPGMVPEERVLTIDASKGREASLGRIEVVMGGTVEGEVVDERGEPVVGARVAAGRVPTYLPIGRLPVGLAATNRSGHFVLRDLAPGSTSIEALHIDIGRNAIDDVIVEAGDTTRGLRITLFEHAEEQAPRLDGEGNVAVTLGDRRKGSFRTLVFEHVPLDGEAERAGIRAGDQLLAIDGVPVVSLNSARSRLSGPLGKELIVTLARPPDFQWSLRVKRERLRR